MEQYISRKSIYPAKKGRLAVLGNCFIKLTELKDVYILQ